MFPPEEVQNNVEVYPQDCPNCKTDAFLSDPIKMHIHQQLELPEIKPEVTQYNLHTCLCNKCGKQVFPKIPIEARKGFGPSIYHEGIEPTNNLAERNLRQAVIWRKLTAGSRSEWGEKHIERLLTITTTLRQRAKNVFEYFVSCFSAWQRAGPIPNPF